MYLKDEIQQTLDDVLFDLNIPVYWKKKHDDVSEYVIYRIISNPNIEFANNIPLLREENVDVNYYASNCTFDHTHIEIIKQAMSEKGWVSTNGETDINFIDDNNIDGTNMEFTREVIVNYG